MIRLLEFDFERARRIRSSMTSQTQELRRDLGVWGAMMMGLGSIVGTGVFVSIAIAAGIAGTNVVFAIALAAVVAICNGLSSAQLAANYPISGGTYEYGYRLLPNVLGFVAGWMFLFAKSASAATAALGLSGYILLGVDQSGRFITTALGIGVLLLLTLLTLVGIKRTSGINIAIVSVTLATLLCFVVMGAPAAVASAPENLPILVSFSKIFNPGDAGASLLHATALMFVAYTGYGRIATLGEEVKDPRRTIPIAVVTTLAVSMLLYLLVALVAVGTVGADTFAAASKNHIAALRIVADQFPQPWVGIVISVGAVTAMLGVLLNLILGLSRVMLAMARRKDMPQRCADVSKSGGVPIPATLSVAAIIGLLVLVGDIKLTWSFSAFAVLIYYSITNLCALQLKQAQRIFPIWTAWVGLVACLTLAFWVDRQVWFLGLGLLTLGLLWFFIAERLRTGASAQGGE